MKSITVYMTVMFAVLASVLLLAACSKTTDNGSSAGNAGTSDNSASAVSTDSGEAPVTSDSNVQASGEPDNGVECGSDSDCGNVIEGDPSCFQGSILIPRKVPKCYYPGTVNSYCKTESKDKIVLCTSSEFCRNGKCLVTAEQPCQDSDGGKNYEESGRVVDGLLEEFVDNCAEDNKILYERYCSDGKFGRGLTEEHRCSGRCSNGACVEDEN